MDSLFTASNMTANQLMIWAASQLYAGQPVHNLCKCYMLPMALDETAFRRAFSALIQASDSFRMVVELEDEGPTIRVLNDVDFELPLLDFSAENQPEEALRQWAEEQAIEPFQPGSRLFDSALVKLADTNYGWYLNQHHIAADGFSTIELLVLCMSDLYQQACNGQLRFHLGLPSFAQAIRQARSFSLSVDGSRIRRFWQDRLSNAVEPPFEHAVNREHDILAERVDIPLGQARSQKLTDLAIPKLRGFNSRMVAALASVMLTQVTRLTGKRTLRIAIPFHGRHNEQDRKTVGLFFHRLPITIEIADSDTFGSLQEKVLAELQLLKQHSPYASPEAGKSYDLLLNFHVAALPRFDGQAVEFHCLHSGYSQKTLSLHVHDVQQSGVFAMWYDARCSALEPTQIRVLGDQFLTLLDAMLQSPSCGIHTASMLSRYETALLRSWNEPTGTQSPEACLHHAFEAQAERTPTAIAVSCGAHRLSYDALNQRANQLAHFLQAQGIGPESLVGICVERSTEMLVALLGILKAGGGYVPLDLAYPPTRLTYMVEDSGIEFVVCQATLSDCLPQVGLSRIDLKADRLRISQMPSSNPQCKAQGENVAYVMYTSG